MIWLIAFLFAAIAILVGGTWLLVHEPRDQAAALEAHLDAHDPTLEVHHETLRDLRPADLAGPDPDEGSGVAASSPSLPADGADDLAASRAHLPGPGDADRDADMGTRLPVSPGSSVRLTPAQRRRAVHKGRIPREEVMPHSYAEDRVSRQHKNLPGPAGELAVLTDGRRAGELHQHHERLPQPLTIYDPMHRRHMPVFGSLVESVAWEARRAEDEHWLGAQLDEFEEWWSAPGRWELVA